jgi:hypothetical protein
VASREARDCFLWGVGTTRSELGEIAGEYLSKGSSVYVPAYRSQEGQPSIRPSSAYLFHLQVHTLILEAS